MSGTDADELGSGVVSDEQPDPLSRNDEPPPAFGTLVAGTDGVVIHASAGACAVLGRAAAEVVGASLGDLAAGRDRVLVEEWIERLSDESDPSEPIRFATSRQPVGSASTRAHLANGDTPRPAVIIELSSSIPAADEVEVGLEERVEQLERTNRSFRARASSSGLDATAPLSAAAASLNDLLGRPTSNLGDGQPVPADLLHELGELTAAVEESVASSRAGLRLDIGQIDGDALIARVQDDLRHELDAASAEVVADPVGSLVGDRQRLREALGRLVDNAVRYRAPDRRLRIEFRVEPLDGHRVIIVADNGKGIPLDDRARVLGLPEHLDASPPGQGFGLSICRRIVEGHGGRFSIEDGIDGGVAIRLELPHGETPAAIELLQLRPH